jgi:tRNA(fMet)-specific endonuclease VapC
VLGELYYGAAHSIQIQRNTAVVRKLRSRYKVLLIDEAVAIEYGKVKAPLRTKGSPIPENDIWIAAIALRNNLDLVTRDKHFNEVSRLKLKAW